MKQDKHESCNHIQRRLPLCLLLCVFSCTFFVYRDFDIRMMYGFLGFGLLLVIYSLQCRITKKPPHMTNYKVMVAVLCIVITVCFLLPYSNHDEDNLSLVVSMLICTAAVILSDHTENMRIAVRALQIAGIAMAVFVLFFALFEDLFWTTLCPLLSDLAQDYLRYYVPRGYGITLGGCTFTDYVIILGMMAISAQLIFDNLSRKKTIVGWLFVLLSAVAVICVGRKGETLAMFATAGTLFLLIGTPRQRKRRITLLLIGILVCIAITAVLLPFFRNLDILKRYVQMLDELLAGNDISSGRFELYALAWKLFWQHPLFGIGWGQFASMIPEGFIHVHNGGGVQVLRDVHCIYLQFLCESGIIGFVCVILPIAYCYLHSLRQLLRLQKAQITDNIRIVRILNYIAFGAQTFLFGIGLIDPSFERVHFWCFYGIALIMQNCALCMEGFAYTGKPEYVQGLCASWIQKIINRIFTGNAKS